SNLRNPVRFHQAITAAGRDYNTFVEVSPHPLLLHAISEIHEGHHHTVPTLQRDTDDTLTFHTNLNATHTARPPQTPHLPEPHPHIPSAPWQHTRHWAQAPAAAAAVGGGHPLLGQGVTDPTTGTRVWERRLSPALLWLGDHRVDGICVLPGTAYAEIALAAAMDAFDGDDAAAWSIGELHLDQLMPIHDDSTTVVTTLTGDASRARVEIRSRTGDSDWTLHASATLLRGAGAPPAPPVPGDGPGAEVSAEELYTRLRGAGQQHGAAFRGVESVRVSDCGVLTARVGLPAEAARSAHAFVAHPVILDIALQVLGAGSAVTDLAAGGSDTPVALPVRFAGVRVCGDVTRAVQAVATLRPAPAADRVVGEVTLIDGDGAVCLHIAEVEAVLLSAPGTGEGGRRYYELAWEQVDLDDDPARVGGSVLIVADRGDDDGLLTAAGALLAQRTDRCEWVSPADDTATIAAIARPDVEWESIVVVCPPRAVDESLPVAAQLELAQSRTLAVARIVTAIATKGVRRNPRLWLVTRAAQQVDPAEPVTLAQAELRGLARVLVFEHPKLKTTTVDADAAGSDSAAALAAEILALAEHDEVALRAGRRTVRRLVPAATTPAGAVAPESRKQTVEVGGPLGYRLEVDAAGRLDGLGVHAVKRPVPQDNQVEIAISLAGLNFADVLKTMGLYPGLRGRAPVIGAECVGVVSAVGDRAGALRVGQRVLALGPGTFGSHLLTSADLVVPIPEQLSDDQAATFGAAYLTAWHSLCEVARLAPGERVLIHSATGGVGLAAIEVARLLGARIYTTAGSQTKRTMLSDMGVEYVGDSRSTAFAAEILDLTAGEGVDVVLNSLAGEAISAGVEVLAPGGRFVELGKKDVHGDGRLVLSGLARSASFAVVDLDLNLRLHPARYRRQLEQILGHAAAGDLAPLPLTVFEFADATEAFRLLASGNHIGKVAISMPRDGSVLATAPPPPAPLVAADGGYIVVGGLGGLGLVTARWLADNGAGTVVLSGRSAPDADTAAAIAEMNRGGTRVEVVAGDIADASTAARLVEAVDAAGYRLAGVVHSAMVLDDEIVSNMSEAAAARVFAAKVAGGWHLHNATAGRDLDWWLAYSSAASLLGSPGQGAYAAANSWLDGLVAYRRAHGLPAVGINWGPWAEVGRAQFFAGLGFDMISKAQGLQAIEELLAADRCRTGVLTLDSRQWFQSFPSAAGSALFARLRDAAPAQDRGGSIRAELDALDAGKRPSRLASAISDEICAVLRSTRPIGHHEAMNTLGLDSLMALELRNRLETALGITLPAALVWAYPTIADLAVVLGERMGYQDDDVPGTAEAEEPVAAQGESALSDEEMELLSGVVKASELEAMTGATES
ncbi:MAG: SDR family oxidoreductase, partial [Actinobacteria bacterium]|nr:SDR family oxidoreductase [Actinomycetota bacterium]